MNPLLFVGVLTFPPVLAAADGSLNVGTMLASYGIAAPFAALCFWQMQRASQKLDKAEETIAKLQTEAVTNARDFAARFGPLLYDSARLYEQGNQSLAQGLTRTQESEIQRLREQVEELLRRIEQP